MAAEKEVKIKPLWFYYISIFSAFLFTLYISIYSTIHFENIRYMNIVIVFLFITFVSFFLISAVYFQTEKIGYHVLAPVLFFGGMSGLIIYAYKAVDASNIVRYSIIYTIIVVGISLFIIIPKKKPNEKLALKISNKKVTEEVKKHRLNENNQK